jgi:hypothetical protein
MLCFTCEGDKDIKGYENTTKGEVYMDNKIKVRVLGECLLGRLTWVEGLRTGYLTPEEVIEWISFLK